MTGSQAAGAAGVSNSALVVAGDSGALLAKLEQAKTLLAESRDVEWVKTLRDQAEAMRVYVRQQQLGHEAEVYAAEIRVRAERRIGELTAALPTDPGGRPPENSPGGRESAAPLKKQMLRQAGITTQRASEYERIAAISPERFEAKLQAAQASTKPVTTAELLRAAPTARPQVTTPPKPTEPARIFPGACPDCGAALSIEVHVNWEARQIKMVWSEPEHDGQDWYPDD
jgi:hypothetical protein